MPWLLENYRTVEPGQDPNKVRRIVRVDNCEYSGPFRPFPLVETRRECAEP